MIETMRTFDSTAKDTAGTLPLPTKRVLMQASFLDQFVLGRMVGSLRPTMIRSTVVFAALVCLGGIQLAILRQEYVVPFLTIAGSSVALYVYAMRENRGGLPLMAIIAMQHGLTYGLPFVVQNETIDSYPISAAGVGAFSFLLFTVACALGLPLGLSWPSSLPSRHMLVSQVGTTATARLARLAIRLLAFAFGFHLLTFTGLYWSVFGQIGVRLYSIVRSFALVATVSGAFFGAFSIQRSQRTALAFWMLWSGTLILVISSVLLSSATILVVGTLMGLFLGGNAVPGAVRS